MENNSELIKFITLIGADGKERPRQMERSGQLCNSHSSIGADIKELESTGQIGQLNTSIGADGGFRH
jgi:hypothetical protein